MIPTYVLQNTTVNVQQTVNFTELIQITNYCITKKKDFYYINLNDSFFVISFFHCRLQLLQTTYVILLVLI